MSIPSPRLLLSPCALPMLFCQELDLAFCPSHPDDDACSSSGGGTGGQIDGMTSTSDTECALLEPVCDTSLDDTCPGYAMGSECEAMTCLADGERAAAINALDAAQGPSGSSHDLIAHIQRAADHGSWVSCDMYPLSLVPLGSSIFGDPQLVATSCSSADSRLKDILKDILPVRNAAGATATIPVVFGGDASLRGAGREMRADEIR